MKKPSTIRLNLKITTSLETYLLTKGQKAKSLILDTAIDIMAEKGFEATSFQKVATALGVSQSAVFHHYKNKSELLKGVLEEIVTRNHSLVQKNINVDDSLEQKLYKHCLSNMQWLVEKPQEAKVIMNLYQKATNDKLIATLSEKIVTIGRQRVIEYIAILKDQEIVAKSIDSASVGRIIHEYLMGALIQVLSIYQSIDINEELALYDIRVKHLLKTLLNIDIK